MTFMVDAVVCWFAITKADFFLQPENFKACATGCRAAQLDAFIVWPVRADLDKCKHGKCEANG